MEKRHLRGRSCLVLTAVVTLVLEPSVAIPPMAQLDPLQIHSVTANDEINRARPGGKDEETAARYSTSAAEGPYASLNVNLLSRVAPQAFSTNSTCSTSITNVCANDIWGYVSPSGREYAIVGLRVGTGFVDVTDAANPVIVGAISDANSWWSDMRTYGEYAFNVNESGGGMQIIDLTQIDPPTRTVTLVGSFTASNLSTAHNIVANESSGFVYLCGANLGGGRLVAVNVLNPTNPFIAGQASDGAYVHDAEVITYTEGPYAGKEIAFCYCGGAGLKIMDVTRKNNIFTLSTFFYPNLNYTHQGRITADRQYLLIDDELDELNNPAVNQTTTYVVDVSDLSNPQFVTSFTSGLSTIDHNLMIVGDYVFEANYSSGLRIFDISDMANITQVGYFDTYPYNNDRDFDGAWGVYPFLPSGVVLVSDQVGGLFVLDASQATGQECPPSSAPQEEPIPSPKPRYLALSPTNPGKQTALRVEIVELPEPFGGSIGARKWLDAPELVNDPKHPGGSFLRSRLTCSPVYLDWGALGTIYVADDEIFSGGAYAVSAISAGCITAAEGNFSSPLMVTAASIWGDVIGVNGTGPPDGSLNVFDVSAMTDTIKEVPVSLDVAQGDLYPSEPDGAINVVELANVVDAVKGYEFPYGGPTGCP